MARGYRQCVGIPDEVASARQGSPTAAASVVLASIVSRYGLFRPGSSSQLFIE
jgi:hypothetical protein